MLQTELIRPLGELLERHATERGAEPAFRDDSRAEDWAGIEDRTRRLAAQLRKLVKPGACVAICMGNRLEGVESYLGVTRAGNVGAYQSGRRRRGARLHAGGLRGRGPHH